MSGAPVGASPRRPGFTLVESLVAMVLVSVVLLGLVPTLFHAIRRQRIDALALDRSAVLMGETNRLLTLPFGDLPGQQGCATVPAPAEFPHELCVEVVSHSNREREILVVVTPGDTVLGADTITLVRTLAATGNPFNASEP